MLDYGVGTNYWKVTFKTLILFLFGTDQLWIQILAIAILSGIFIFSLLFFLKNPFSLFSIYSKTIFFTVILITTILAFYLQKKLLDVNYPEDRTGLFFYLFFVLSFAFIIDQISNFPSAIIASGVLIASLGYFILNVNLKDFSSLFYHTMPKALFDKLTEEYKKTNQIFTIGGHRVRELNYAFLNYRGGAVLNHMDESEQMAMNCDYYYAMTREKPYYEPFYEVIGEDKTWGRVLLKRKEKINKKEGFSFPGMPKNYNSDQEYFEFLRFGDTLINSGNCLEADLAITFKNVPKPFNSFLVFSVDNDKGEHVYFKRMRWYWLDGNFDK